LSYHSTLSSPSFPSDIGQSQGSWEKYLEERALFRREESLLQSLGFGDSRFKSLHCSFVGLLLLLLFLLLGQETGKVEPVRSQLKGLEDTNTGSEANKKRTR
jgi:hypothetical protein